MADPIPGKINDIGRLMKKEEAENARLRKAGITDPGVLFSATHTLREPMPLGKRIKAVLAPKNIKEEVKRFNRLRLQREKLIEDIAESDRIREKRARQGTIQRSPSTFERLLSRRGGGK